MDQFTAGFFAVGITLMIAYGLYRSHKVEQARANFPFTGPRTQGGIHPPLHQVRDHPLTWVRSQPNTYTLCANSDVLAVLYLDDDGSLVGVESADGPWVVKGERSGFDLSLRQLQSQIDVAKVRYSSSTIEFPTGRLIRYMRENTTYSWYAFGWKGKWTLLDDSREPLIFMEEDSRIVKIAQRAYSMPELPFLVLLGGYLMIVVADYPDD